MSKYPYRQDRDELKELLQQFENLSGRIALFGQVGRGRFRAGPFGEGCISQSRHPSLLSPHVDLTGDLQSSESPIPSWLGLASLAGASCCWSILNVKVRRRVNRKGIHGHTKFEGDWMSTGLVRRMQLGSNG